MNWLQKIYFKEAGKIPKLKTVPIRTIAKFLEYMGFYPESQKGSHVKYYKPGWHFKPELDLDSRKTLPSGTQNSIARQMGLTGPEFALGIARMRGIKGFTDEPTQAQDPVDNKPPQPSGLDPKTERMYVTRLLSGQSEKNVLQGLPDAWKDHILKVYYKARGW